MLGNPMNIPPISISGAKAALIEQYADTTLRRRASMLWGPRGVGKSSVVRQVAAHFGVPLVDLRLTTIEPVDIRGAIYADDVQGKTVWFPPEFLPTADQPAGILFLDELTAADQRLQISAYSLILDRRVGHYVLPDGWQVVAAGNASFHGAVSHDMGTALADRMFHFNVQTAIDAFLAHAVASGFAPEVMAYLRVRPDKLDDTQAQLAADHLIGASPRGWEDVSNVLKSRLSDSAKRVFVQGRIGAANAAEFFGVLREIQSGADVLALLAARPGKDTVDLLPRSLDGLYGMTYGLLAACTSNTALARALEIVEQLPDIRSQANTPALPVREVQTLAMELMMQKALETGLEATIMDSPAYHRYAERRRKDGLAS
ncbi:MAG: AAA family ATPase [Burkholderiales bacterium]|nr:AAA family ATPase [Burkholderiales bacterium]